MALLQHLCYVNVTNHYAAVLETSPVWFKWVMANNHSNRQWWVLLGPTLPRLQTYYTGLSLQNDHGSGNPLSMNCAQRHIAKHGRAIPSPANFLISETFMSSGKVVVLGWPWSHINSFGCTTDALPKCTSCVLVQSVCAKPASLKFCLQGFWLTSTTVWAIAAFMALFWVRFDLGSFIICSAAERVKIVEIRSVNSMPLISTPSCFSGSYFGLTPNLSLHKIACCTHLASAGWDSSFVKFFFLVFFLPCSEERMGAFPKNHQRRAVRTEEETV